MINRKDFCVLLAAYNGEQFIEEQLNSILAQSKVTLDIYINLDRSTDNTLDIINYLKSKNRNIYLFNSGRVFGSASKNFFYLIENVNFDDYDFISFSDQDDIWLEDKLYEAKKLINEKNLDGYAANTTLFKKNSKKLIKKNYLSTEYDFLFEGGGPGHTIVITKKNMLLITKKLKTQKKKFDIINYYDWFIYFFIRAKKGKWFIDEKSYTLYRQHDHNEIGSNTGLHGFLKRLNVLFKNNLFEESKNYAEICGIFDLEKFKIIYKKNFKSFLFVTSNFYRFRRKNFDKLIFLFAYIILFLRRL